MTKKYQICHHQIRFYKLKMHQNPFSAGALPRTPLGELTTLPQTPIVGWGGGYPSLFPSPLDAFGVSNSRFSGPLNTKSWLRQCWGMSIGCIDALISLR